MAYQQQQRGGNYQNRPQATKQNISEHLTALVDFTKGRWSADEIELIWNTVPDTVSLADFRLFLYRAKQKNLDPLLNEIYCQSRWDKEAERYKMTIATTIDGARKACDLTGEYDGNDIDYIYDDQNRMMAAKATVFRRGCNHGFSAIARYTEYCQTKSSGEPNRMWEKMPYTMTGKCAEALALRKAFPAAMAGIYTTDEMAQADNDTPVQPHYAPKAETADSPSTKVTTIGNYKIPEKEPEPVAENVADATPQEEPTPNPKPEPKPETKPQGKRELSESQKVGNQLWEKLLGHFKMTSPDFQTKVYKPFAEAWFGGTIPLDATVKLPMLATLERIAREGNPADIAKNPKSVGEFEGKEYRERNKE